MNLNETREWLEILYSETPGHINICSTGNFAGQCFPASDVDSALNYVAELDQVGKEGIYLRATTLRQEPEPGRRGGDALSSHLPGLWADVDIDGPGHKHKGPLPLPPSIDEAMRIVLESGLPEPSHWIHSGGGLYPWWILREAAPVDDLEDFRNLAQGWQEILGASAKKLGYHYGTEVGDLSRVLRLPGTVNRKAGLERPCMGLPGHTWSGRVFELAELFDALAANTPQPPAPTRIELKVQNSASADGTRPGDDFSKAVSWNQLLMGDGWQFIRKTSYGWILRRPGKERGEGSATLWDSTDNLYVFSTEAPYPLQARKHYSKFAYYTFMKHNGDFKAAAKDLSAKGFGTPLERSSQSAGNRVLLDSAETMRNPAPRMARAAEAMADTTQESPATPIGWDEDFGAPQLTVDQFLEEDFTRQGAGDLYAKAYQNAFKYCEDVKKWWFWTGKVWRRDGRGRHIQAGKEIINLGREAHRKAVMEQQDYSKALERHLDRMANTASPSVHLWAQHDKRIGIECDEFDSIGQMVTAENGIIELESQTLMPHDPHMLLTKQIPVTFDKDAQCPGWLSFLEQALPDTEIRDYLQRAIGHTLLGKAEQRALFLLHGPSGTGKSVFIRVMEQLFGDFAETATPATFNASSKTATLTNDLNDLKGKRFVSLSELDEGEQLNESLVKRLTGGDTAKSRTLYQENSMWRVEFTMWLATNNKPKLNSDDNAIWRRVKPIPFNQVAADNGGEVLRLAEKLFAEEASGILNWILDGVRMYQQEGLEDLQQIQDAVKEYRREVDVVEQFISQSLEEGVLVATEGAEIQSSRLYDVFTNWCQKNGMKGVFSNRRFSIRLERMGYVKRVKSTANFWVGLNTGSHGLLGMMT